MCVVQMTWFGFFFFFGAEQTALEWNGMEWNGMEAEAESVTQVESVPALALRVTPKVDIDASEAKIE